MHVPLSTDEPRPPDAMLAVSVWFEPEHGTTFRARLRSLEPEGHTQVVGATTSRHEVTDMVRKWLETLT